MKESSIARVTYDCITPKGHSFTLTAHLFDGFDSGNHHVIVITEESGYEYGLDARYNCRFDTKEGFYANILEVLKDRYKIGEAKLVAKE